VIESEPTRAVTPEKLQTGVLLATNKHHVMRATRTKLNIAIELVHDITLPEAQDDKLLLFSSEDEGVTYKQEVLLRKPGERLADDGKGHLRALFTDVSQDTKYTCYLDLGLDAKGKSAGVFPLFRDFCFEQKHHVDGLS